MYIVTVIPLKKGLQKEYLTYFSANPIQLGMIVEIPVRLKTVDAIVIGIQDALDIKSNIKTAEYQLKKISSIKGPSPFSKHFFTACAYMKDYTISTTGEVIKAMLPAIYLQQTSLLKTPLITAEENTSTVKHEKLIFQALAPERYGFYRTLIREAFAKKESVFICVPTRYDIEELKNILSRGIEQYVFTFHGDMSKKSLVTKYNECIEATHPLLIIATGMFLSIPRHDIQTIILEHESSDTYKQFARPYIDVRSFVEVLASIKKSKLIVGDTLLRPETLHRRDQDEFGEVASPLFRLPTVERQFVVDMKEEVDDRGIKKFTVLSEKTKKNDRICTVTPRISVSILHSQRTGRSHRVSRLRINTFMPCMHYSNGIVWCTTTYSYKRRIKSNFYVQ